MKKKMIWNKLFVRNMGDGWERFRVHVMQFNVRRGTSQASRRDEKADENGFKNPSFL
jgi:hypothetical protein